MRPLCSLLCLALFALACDLPQERVKPDRYVNFETVPNRALALTPDGRILYALNVPDSRLEIFKVEDGALSPLGSAVVGLDPIALALRPDGKRVWVVNHLSDSVSIVDVSDPKRPSVVNTLAVGDEPRDIVFADGGRRAFISAVHRGQNHPAGLPALLEEATGKSRKGLGDVWVFEAERDAPRGPLAVLGLPLDKLGNLTTSPDGSRVYASVLTSGNRTTSAGTVALCSGNAEQAGFGQNSAQDDGPCALPNGGTAPGGTPAPNANQVDGLPTPRTGTIVRFQESTGAWLDAARRDWRDAIPFTVPDQDVVALDARSLKTARTFAHVGTLNHNLLVHPKTGAVYVTNTDAINTNRFVSLPAAGLVPNPQRVGGAAVTADPLTGKTLNGHLYESRVTILRPDGKVVPRHLNPHIDYEVVPSPPGVKERSLSDPRGLALSKDGETLYVAALGSNTIAALPLRTLDDGSFTPDAKAHVQLSGDGGPTDMVISRDGKTMFAYRRFDNAISAIDLEKLRELRQTAMHSPEPTRVRAGRKFLYDARLTSSNGESSCNSCHLSGDKDDLAWDFGAPFFGEMKNPNAFVPVATERKLDGDARASNKAVDDLFPEVDPRFDFNPLKGPMTVLTLRGIKDGGPMFWKGDATNPDDPSDARKNFEFFNIIFPAALGRADVLPQQEFDAFADFVFTLTPPPNPYRPLDGVLLADQKEGEELFFGNRKPTDGPLDCENCHITKPELGFFGTAGENGFEPPNTQYFKVTSLRLAYDKIGMTGATTGDIAPRSLGPQIRAIGFSHDGSRGSLVDFQRFAEFDLTEAEREKLSKYIAAFPGDLAPAVGQQVTVRADSGKGVRDRLRVLEAAALRKHPRPDLANATECDLVAHARIEGREVGFLMIGDDLFLSDGGRPRRRDELLELARKERTEVTFTCVYPGGGRRLALDRDGDGIPNAFDPELGVR
jgi:YVTN family beta-propeller protein